MDNFLVATVLIIFFTALLSRIVQKQDRVLKSIKGFHITIVKRNGKRMWGVVKIYTNGMELLFTKPFQSSGGSWVDSYLFYQPDMDDVKLICRYHDELSPENQKTRIIEIEKVSKPGNLRRLLRKLRNFISNFQDAISETLSVFLNRFKSNAAEIVKANEKRLKQVGTSAINAVSKEYDPILEYHINKKVVISVINGESKQEFTGYLGEYSIKWMALIDCELQQDWHLPLNDLNKLILNRSIDVVYKITQKNGQYGLELEISNFGQVDVRLKRIVGNEFSKNIYKTISTNETIKTTLTKLPAHVFPERSNEMIDKTIENIAPERGGKYHAEAWSGLKGNLPDLELVYSCKRHVDVYLPRSTSILRHSVAGSGAS